MRTVWAMAACAVAALAGCSQPRQPYDASQLEYSNLELAAYRGYAAAFSATPFASGGISVIASEGLPPVAHLSTFRLVPCGTTICAGSATGPQGTLEVTPDYHVVSGLYGGRTFWISPGGDGAIRYPDGTAVAASWD